MIKKYRSVLLLMTFTALPSLAGENITTEVSTDKHAHHDNMDNAANDGMPVIAPSSFIARPAEGTFFICPVSGGVFEVESHTRMSLYEGKYYAFCCGGCAQDFKENPKHFVDRLAQTKTNQTLAD